MGFHSLVSVDECAFNLLVAKNIEIIAYKFQFKALFVAIVICYNLTLCQLYEMCMWVPNGSFSVLCILLPLPCNHPAHPPCRHHHSHQKGRHLMLRLDFDCTYALSTHIPAHHIDSTLYTHWTRQHPHGRHHQLHALFGHQPHMWHFM